jgi:hypothetical protein
MYVLDSCGPIGPVGSSVWGFVTTAVNIAFLSAVQLRDPFFCDVTLCQWASRFPMV